MRPIFYLTWFFKCYERKESGWWLVRTPDDTPIAHSNGFLIRSMEIIQRTMNLMISEEQARKGMS